MTLHADRPGPERGLPAVASLTQAIGVARAPLELLSSASDSRAFLPSSQHCTGEPVIGTALSGTA